MKMDRLIGILSILLQQDRVTAPQLAQQFEVSRRTIQRDIETLCRAGIPVCTLQGAGGGIALMEGYRVDRTLLTAPEMQAILAGLRSLDSVSGTRSAGAGDACRCFPARGGAGTGRILWDGKKDRCFFRIGLFCFFRPLGVACQRLSTHTPKFR